jgi:acetoin utilization protein AcuC
MKTAFLYTDAFAAFEYGPGHPLKPVRLKLTHDLIRACGLLGPSDPRLVQPPPARTEDLLSFHTRDYIGMLRGSNSGRPAPGADAYGLGPGDNPVFPGMFDWSRLIAGASIKAAEMVDSGETETAFNIAGGLHHAHPSRASGFCYINDPVLAIQLLVDRGRRVAYIDIDAHHGDGVQEAFYGTDRVLTISLHETGRMLFPGSGYENETGAHEGSGYSVNVPLPPETDDDLFTYAFRSTVPPLIDAFMPDIIVSQLGVDTFRTDPLAHMNVTTNGFCEIVRMIRDLSPKWVALGGGGYDIANVARAWTLAWAIMNRTEAPEEIPAAFLEQNAGAGFLTGKLRDGPFRITGAQKERMKRDVDGVIGDVREHALRIR